MKVTDKNGFELEVTNLDEAIRQSEAFVALNQIGEDLGDFKQRQKTIGQTYFEKLSALKNKHKVQKNYAYF